jgi:two-component system, NarL family, invasion response regulator UvrY
MHYGIKLIIVDDHQMVRETWKMILQKDERVDVIADCGSATEAIALAARLQPEIMLMDVNMAPVNGLEATAVIVKENPEIRIIGVSINNEPSYARSMMQCGAKGYVTKHSTREEMIRAILEVHQGNTYICSEIREKMPNQ